jgi:hypothetical protein
MKPYLLLQFTASEYTSYRELKEKVITELETQFCNQVLTEHKGNVSLAAQKFCMDRKHIAHLMKKHKITRLNPEKQPYPCPFEDKLCPVCKQELKPCPSGWSCINGHGF